MIGAMPKREREKEIILGEKHPKNNWNEKWFGLL